jgi:hypothetical protein
LRSSLGAATAHATLALLATVAFAAASTPASAPAPRTAATAQGGGVDLVVSRERIRSSINIRTRKASAGDCTLFEGCLGGEGTRRTLEFDTYVINDGTADLRLGRPADRPDLYEYSACHGHYHLKNSFQYSISHGGTDSVGLFDPSAREVLVRNARTSGPADASFPFEGAGATSLPIAGDWDRLGESQPGLYDPVTSQFTLEHKGNAPAESFVYRPESSALLPVAGDWDGDGRDTVGLYSPATHTFYLKKKNNKNRKATAVVLDPGPGDWVPVAGDWDGDDVDTPGLYDRETGVFALRNENRSGGADLAFAFGAPGLVPLAGDWNRDGVDTVAVFDPATGTFSQRDDNSTGDADATLTLEASAPFDSLVPVAGDWDYEPGDVVVPGHKEAFCWLDTQRISGNRDMQFRDCNTDQGLTAGWCDIYIRNTDCQWIDITGLAPGTYQLTVAVNGSRLINESDYTNNAASIKVRIPASKHVAKAPEVRVVAPRGDETFVDGEPIEIRWRVAGGRSVTHQEIWLIESDPDHPSKVMLIDGAVPAGVRRYTWTPPPGYSVAGSQIIVRAQNDTEFVGTDARSRGLFTVRSE